MNTDNTDRGVELRDVTIDRLKRALYNQHVSNAAQAEIQSESAASFRSFSFGERVKLWLISWAGFLFIRVVGTTLRYQFIPEPGCLADEHGPGPLRSGVSGTVRCSPRPTVFATRALP